jgi:DNA polymerase III delta subunit
VCGDNEFLRESYLRSLVKSAESKGLDVERVPAGDEQGLYSALRGSLTSDVVLVLVEGGSLSKKAASGTWSASVVEEILSSPKGIRVVVYQDTSIASGTLAGALSEAPGVVVNDFMLPKPWQAVEHAARFFASEMKRHKKIHADDLPEKVVRRVGTDYGLLASEARKASTYLDALGRLELTAQDVVQVMVSMGTSDWDQLKSALVNRDHAQVCRLLWHIRSGPDGESPAKALSILTALSSRWLHAAVLSQSGIPESEAASQVGVHLYAYQREVLPAVQRWGPKSLLGLSSALSSCNLRRGLVNPWVALESSLVASCLGSMTL